MRPPSIRRWLVHQVTVEPYAGRSSVGDVYGEPFTLRCLASGKRRMVRDNDGAERLSTLTLVAEPGKAELVPPGSRVTWTRGRITTVVVASTEQDAGNLGAPNHTEVVCE